MSMAICGSDQVSRLGTAVSSRLRRSLPAIRLWSCRLGLSLDNGVKPSEISEIVTHLAFYTGWANAIAAIPAAKQVFTSRNIGADQLPAASGPQLPLDEATEKQRATRVGEQFGQVPPSLVQYTTDVLFRIYGSGRRWLRATAA
jgi:hypothetical protein